MDLDIIKKIENEIGYTFIDKKLLISAFTHSSFSNQFGGINSYEKLEFIGDSILNTIVSIYLHEKYPEEAQGFLSKTRSIIISNTNIAKAIEALEIVSYLRTSDTIVEISTKLKADLYESVVGAIYLDSKSLLESSNFISKTLGDSLHANYTGGNVTDSKSALFEFAAKEGIELKFITKRIDLKEPKFVSNLYFKQEIYGTGSGTSKKQAEQIAAAAAIKKFGL